MGKCLVVTGPTASGKTHLATALAKCFNGEIVSADSRQVFRGLDIGTGKDLHEYSEADVAYHLIDVAEPGEDFHLFRYLSLARDALSDVWGREKLAVVCGGSPLYIKALLDGYDQEGGAPNWELRKELEQEDLGTLIGILRQEATETLFDRTDLTQKRRVIRSIELARFGRSVEPKPIIGENLILAPYFPRQELHKRIEKRLDERLEAGMLEEVRRLHDEGMSWEKMDWLGLEYRFAAKVLTGELDFKEFRDSLLAHIRQFCKRQDGWFRKLERDGKHIHWLPSGDKEQAAELVQTWLAGGILPQPVLRMNDIRYSV